MYATRHTKKNSRATRRIQIEISPGIVLVRQLDPPREKAHLNRVCSVSQCGETKGGIQLQTARFSPKLLINGCVHEQSQAGLQERNCRMIDMANRLSGSKQFITNGFCHGRVIFER